MQTGCLEVANVVNDSYDVLILLFWQFSPFYLVITYGHYGNYSFFCSDFLNFWEKKENNASPPQKMFILLI